MPDGFVVRVFVPMEMTRLTRLARLQCPYAAVLSTAIPFVFPNDFGCSPGGGVRI